MAEQHSNTKSYTSKSLFFSGRTSNPTPFINCLQDKKYYLTRLLRQGEHKSIKETVIYDSHPIHPPNENKHLDDSRPSQFDWSLLLKEDFRAVLIILILQEDKMPSDRENM